MSTLTRLVTRRLSPFERRLLEGGASEKPQLRARLRMAHSLGMSPLVVYASVAKKIMGSWLGNLGMGLTVGIGVVIAALAPQGELSDTPRRAASSPTSPKVVRQSTPVDAEAREASTAVAQPRACELKGERVEPEVAPAVSATRAAPPTGEAPSKVKAAQPAASAVAKRRDTAAEGASRRVDSHPARSGESTLSGEISLLDRARARINAGQAKRAMPLLDSYRQRFPTGVLARESEVLRQRILR